MGHIKIIGKSANVSDHTEIKLVDMIDDIKAYLEKDKIVSLEEARGLSTRMKLVADMIIEDSEEAQSSNEN